MSNKKSLLRWSQIWNAHKTGAQSQDFVLAVEVLTAAISRSTDVTQLGTPTRAELNKKLEALMNAISAAKSGFIITMNKMRAGKKATDNAVKKPHGTCCVALRRARKRLHDDGACGQAAVDYE